MKYIVLWLFTAANLWSAEIPQAARDNAMGYVTNGHTPGLILGFTNGDDLSFFATGATHQDGPAIDEHAVFEIGRVTQVFTGLLLARAVGEGKVILEQDMATLLGDRVSGMDAWPKQITLKHLATHASSLPRFPDNTSPSTKGPYADYTNALLYEYLSQYTTPLNTGLLFKYSSLGMGLLGHLLSLTYEKDYATLINEKICVPLALKKTGMALDEKAGLVKGHNLDGEPITNWRHSVLEGSDGLCSSAHDLLGFLKANMKGGPLREAMDLAQLPHFKPLPGIQRGLGWRVTFVMGQEMIWHSGRTDGYSCFLGFNKSSGKGSGKGVVVLANAPINLDNLGMHLLNPKVPLKKAVPNLPVPKEILEKAPGYYAVQPQGDIVHITRKETGLYATMDGKAPRGLYLNDRDRFYFRDNRTTLSFPDPAKPGLKIHKGRNEISAEKLSPRQWPPKPKKLKTKVLASYPGVYKLPDYETLEVKLEKDHLTLLWDKNTYTLIPTGSHVFFLQNRFIRLEFQKKGKAEGLVLHLPDQTLEAVRESGSQAE